jgi:hypothetical protein
MKIDLAHCYSRSWKSFAKWWIPLCLISSIIFVFDTVPRLMVRTDTEVKVISDTIKSALLEQDFARLNEILEEVKPQMYALTHKFIRLGASTIPFVALLTVILLMYANWAAKNRKERRRPLGRLIYIAVIHLILALGKLLACILFVPFGAYLYIKLLFVSLVMLEGSTGAAGAIKISWQMTRGNFWPLLLLVAINSGLQVISAPTIIGVIPVTGFVNTVRATAFRLIWEEGNYLKSEKVL